VISASLFEFCSDAQAVWLLQYIKYTGVGAHNKLSVEIYGL